MGIRPTDVVSLPREGDVVRRVEPESETREFGQKEQPSQAGRKRRSGQEDSAEQDTVEVSEQYLAAAQGEETSPDADSPPADAASPERHLDIQA